MAVLLYGKSCELKKLKKRKFLKIINLYRALESDTAQIQELCLSIIPGFAGKYLVYVFLFDLEKVLKNVYFCDSISC